VSGHKIGESGGYLVKKRERKKGVSEILQGLRGGVVGRRKCDILKHRRRRGNQLRARKQKKGK